MAYFTAYRINDFKDKTSMLFTSNKISAQMAENSVVDLISGYSSANLHWMIEMEGNQRSLLQKADKRNLFFGCALCPILRRT